MINLQECEWKAGQTPNGVHYLECQIGFLFPDLADYCGLFIVTIRSYAKRYFIAFEIDTLDPEYDPYAYTDYQGDDDFETPLAAVDTVWICAKIPHEAFDLNVNDHLLQLRTTLTQYIEDHHAQSLYFESNETWLEKILSFQSLNDLRNDPHLYWKDILETRAEAHE